MSCQDWHPGSRACRNRPPHRGIAIQVPGLSALASQWSLSPASSGVHQLQLEGLCGPQGLGTKELCLDVSPNPCMLNWLLTSLKFLSRQGGRGAEVAGMEGSFISRKEVSSKCDSCCNRPIKNMYYKILFQKLLETQNELTVCRRATLPNMEMLLLFVQSSVLKTTLTFV